MEGEQPTLLRLRSATFVDQLAASVAQAPEIRQRQRSYPDEDPVPVQLADHFSAQPDAQAGWIRIGFTHADPLVAALVVNLAAQQARQSGMVSRTGPELQQLEAAELELQRFRAANPDLISVAERTAGLSEQITGTQSAAAGLQERIGTLSRRLRAIDGGDLEPLSTNSGVTRIRQQFERSVVQQQKLGSRYGPRHRRMMDADAEVAASKLLLDREVATARTRLVDERESLRVELASRHAEIGRLQDAARALDDARVEEQRLELQLSQARRRHSTTGPGEPGLPAKAPVPTSPDDQNHVEWLAIMFLATSILIFVLQWLRRP